MKLQAVRITNFRSVEDVSLWGCRQFNVLIGKNNSGKSNLLTGIDFFFEVIQGGALFKLEPRIGRPIDFFGNDASKFLSIKLRFNLTSDEQKELAHQIITEKPQIREAVDRLDPTLALAICVQVVPHPRRFAYVKEVTLEGPDGSSTSPPITLCHIGADAAVELSEIVTEARRTQSNVDALERVLRYFDQDDWQMAKGGATEAPPGTARRRVGAVDTDFVFRRYLESPSPDLVAMLTKTVRDSDSFGAFTTGVRSYIAETSQRMPSLDNVTPDYSRHIGI